jgi:hypothetical protein
LKIDHLLWHTSQRITTHYSEAQLANLTNAADEACQLKPCKSPAISWVNGIAEAKDEAHSLTLGTLVAGAGFCAYMDVRLGYWAAFFATAALLNRALSGAIDLIAIGITINIPMLQCYISYDRP